MILVNLDIDSVVPCLLGKNDHGWRNWQRWKELYTQPIEPTSIRKVTEIATKTDSPFALHVCWQDAHYKNAITCKHVIFNVGGFDWMYPFLSLACVLEAESSDSAFDQLGEHQVHRFERLNGDDVSNYNTRAYLKHLM